jgi:hypothetical protein
MNAFAFVNEPPKALIPVEPGIATLAPPLHPETTDTTMRTEVTRKSQRHILTSSANRSSAPRHTR